MLALLIFHEVWMCELKKTIRNSCLKCQCLCTSIYIWVAYVVGNGM